MRIKITVAVCAAFIAIVLGIAIGSVYIPPTDVLRILAHNIFGAELPERVAPAHTAIVWSSRLPRVLLAFCAGAALSVSGAVMQSVLRNPLASSYTLGVSSGASLGASFVIFLGFSLPLIPMMTLPILGFTFGLGTILLVMGISSRLDTRMENHTIILTGMVFSLFINAITTLMFTFFREGTQRMILWQMGSFNARGWTPVTILAPAAVIGVLIISRFKWELDVMTFGEEQAHTAGVKIKSVKLMLLISAAALTGSTIAFVGVVGFVDLFAPHIVRKLFGAAHRYVIPMSAVIGGTFMVAADLAARTVTAPVDLPVGAVTAIIGAPFFAYIYFGGRKKSAGA
ncbi:MAG: iron ABC transporter permease [Defluviitaleaceae bacterium]|nr:iron ABC transporter permease [Defluviitaleaceae bacterium]MCL2836229.1 iron ABC transporter permease [Defluviitaleaceae bacterium]